MITPAGGYLTVCRIPGCGKEIARAPRELDVPLDGQPDMATLQYIGALQKHLKKKHPEHAARLESAALEFGVMLLTQCFRIDDQTVTKRADLIRDSFINQFAFQLSDEQIDATVDRVMDVPRPGETRVQVRDMIRAFRDLLTCRGQYAPKTTPQTEAPLVTVP